MRNRFSVELIGQSLGHLLFGSACIACGASTGCSAGTLFCDDCQSGVWPLVTPKCSRCALPFDGGHQDHLCGVCGRQPPPFATVWAPYRYGGPVAEAISRYKFRQERWIGAALGNAIVTALPERLDLDLVVPVPLAKTRLRERGFNQSALLAKVVAKSRRLQCDAVGLRRHEDAGGHQVSRSRVERLNALKTAFWVKCPSRFENRKILLVDDVVTTGATCRAAAQTLLADGALTVCVAAVARTPAK